MLILPDPLEFDWDQGNREKNWTKHKVSQEEAEQTFVNQPRFLFRDKPHSETEERMGMFGRSNSGRELAIIFVIRSNKVRIVSARDMSRKERRSYEEIKKAKGYT